METSRLPLNTQQRRKTGSHWTLHGENIQYGGRTMGVCLGYFFFSTVTRQLELPGVNKTSGDTEGASPLDYTAIFHISGGPNLDSVFIYFC